MELLGRQQVYRTLFLMWLSHLFVDIMIGIWPVYKTMADLDLAKAGLIAAAGASAGEGTQILFGALGDKGYRKVLVFCGLIGVCASAFLALTTDYLVLFLLFLITCIGSGMFHPNSVSIVNHMPVRRKKANISFYAMGGALGLALSQIIFSQTYLLFDGNTTLLIVPILLLFVFMAFFFNFPNVEAEVEHRNFSLRNIKHFFERKELRALYISQVCNQAMMWGTIFLLPDILHAKGYENWIAFGGGHFCFIVGGAAMMVPAGFLADHYSARTVMFWGNLIGFLLVYGFLFGPLLPPAAVCLWLFVQGAALGMINPIGVGLGHQLMPRHPGLVSAIMMGLVWFIAEAIGPGGGGFLTKLFEINIEAKALGVLNLLLVIAGFMIIRLPKVESE